MLRLKFRKGVLGLHLCLLLFLLLFPATAVADIQKRIVVIETLPVPIVQDATKWFRDSLDRSEYGRETKITYEIVNANGDPDKAQNLLKTALAEGTPDLVVTVATLASRAARKILRDTDIPQIFMMVSDPVGEQFVDQMGRASGSNITGRSHVVPADSQLAVASTILKTAGRDAPFKLAIVRSDYPSAVSESKQLLKAAPAFPGVTFVDLSVPYLPGADGMEKMRQQLKGIIESRKDEFDGLWTVAGPLQSNVETFSMMLGQGLPIVNGGSLANVREGAMLALQSTSEFNGKAAAEVARAILDGADIRTIPVTRPANFTAGVNISTAQMLGALIPSEIMELARENIFH